MWLARSADERAWATRPADADAIGGNGLFEAPVARTLKAEVTMARVRGLVCGG